MRNKEMQDELDKISPLTCDESSTVLNWIIPIIFIIIFAGALYYIIIKDPRKENELIAITDISVELPTTKGTQVDFKESDKSLKDLEVSTRKKSFEKTLEDTSPVSPQSSGKSSVNLSLLETPEKLTLSTIEKKESSNYFTPDTSPGRPRSNTVVLKGLSSFISPASDDTNVFPFAASGDANVIPFTAQGDAKGFSIGTKKNK